MSPWVEFFRILCRHSQGYQLDLKYEAAVSHPGQDQLPGILYMVGLPKGAANGASVLAEEWKATEGAR